MASDVSHSSKSGAPPEQDRPKQAPLVSAGRLLANRGVLGLIWADENLTITGRYGDLVSFVEIGEPLTQSVPPFVGLENDILALKSGDPQLLDLPIVSIVRGPEASPKLNFTALWSPEQSGYVVLVSRAGDQTNIEVELSRQIRARLIAEAEVTHKSAALSKANAELERANGDLEQFASIISHDLKGPMRALRYMTEDLANDASLQDAPAARAQLEKMRAQSRRMSGMLTSLLEYSSAGRKEEVVEEVDTSELVQAIINSMPRPPGIEVRLSGEWPVIETLRAPLDLVLRNLFDNAIKHHDRVTGVIRAGCESSGSGLRFEIEDDGPGIDPHYHAAMFLPFRRLNSVTADIGQASARNPDQDLGLGQGMGLAFVKRWVEAAGGQIGIVSNAPAQRGALFWFSWPSMAGG